MVVVAAPVEGIIIFDGKAFNSGLELDASVAVEDVLYTNSTITNSNEPGVLLEGVSGGFSFAGYSTLVLISNNITTHGDSNAGVILSDSLPTLHFADNTVVTHGENAPGARLTRALLLSPSLDITTKGNNSNGIEFFSTFSALSLHKSKIRTEGNDSIGLLKSGSPSLVFNDIEIVTTGDRSIGLEFLGTGRDSFSGHIRTGKLGVNSNAAAVKINNSVESLQGNFVTLGHNSPGIERPSVWTGSGENVYAVGLSNSFWNITRNSSIGYLLNNDGTLRGYWRINYCETTSPYARNVSNTEGSFKTLTLKEYVGKGTASVYLNARFTGDDSTGTNSDKIVVLDGGSMKGATTFHINNIGGTGAATYDGIEKDAKWADMSVGMSYQTSDSVNIYGHLKQSVAIDGGTNTTTSGAIGVQKSW